MQGFHFLRKHRAVWMLTGRRDESFVDWQEFRKIRALLTGRRDASFVDWQDFGKMRALLTDRRDESFVDWQER